MTQYLVMFCRNSPCILYLVETENMDDANAFASPRPAKHAMTHNGTNDAAR